MNNFEGHINGDKPVVVDFSASWSNPCKLMEPVLHEVKEVVGERATILKIDIDQSPQYAELYDVRSVPALIIFKQGNIVWRKNGIIPAHEILQHLNLHF
jgi:thioredoxin 1